MNSAQEDTTGAAASAITRRIMLRHTDLLTQYGPTLVMQAIDDVAEGLNDLEEIGSSDVSCWVNEVQTKLKLTGLEDQPPFVRYLLDFYGEHGIYDMSASAEEIIAATNEYKEKLAEEGKDFEGDSVDREAVRDIMIAKRQEFIARRASIGPSL